MFVLAWSLLSSYAESVRRRRLHTALSAFFDNPLSESRMIVCRPAAHRLTRLLGAGFSSWGADTANGSLARVASEPFLNRDPETTVADPPVLLYRSELVEVVAVPDEILPSSDWQLLSTPSIFAPSPNSVYFVAATVPGYGRIDRVVGDEERSRKGMNGTEGEGGGKSEEEEGVDDTTAGEVILESACIRIGENRARPEETLYACEADTFTSVVFAWTNGSLSATRRGREPIAKLRSVWLNPPSVSASGASSSRTSASEGISVSCPTSPPRSLGEGELTPRARSPCSESRRSSSAKGEVVELRAPRPLLEQLFIGDAFEKSSFASLLGSAIINKLGSDGAIDLIANATLPRRALSGRRSHFYETRHLSSLAAVPSPPPDHPHPPPSGRAVLGTRSLRSSRSSLRHRAWSPLAIDLPRFRGESTREGAKTDRSPGSALDAATTVNGFSEHIPRPLSNRSAVCAVIGSGRSRGGDEGTDRPPLLREESGEQTPRDTPSETVRGAEERRDDKTRAEIDPSGEEDTVSECFNSFISPTITLSDFDDADIRSLAEGRIDSIRYVGQRVADASLVQREEEEEESEGKDMPLDTPRSSSARRPKTAKLHRQETTPRADSSLSARLPRRAAQSPMLEMLRGRVTETSWEGPIDPQLQKLTTIELLQRRRHSHMMYPFENGGIGGLFQDDGGRRRSLSPMALNASLQGASDLLRGPLEGATRRSQSRRLHSVSREKGPAHKPAMKPPSVLVYTAGQGALYERIRSCLSSILPPHVYTTFHISPEAIRKAHWIDSSSACLILADTKELDDAAWAQLQEYFNKSGKIIFVCQNSLLSSISSCDSIKKQTSMLRMAFGEKAHGSMSKDLEAFLKKTLKTLGKTGEVNERYQSKDLVGGLKYSVVLSKKQDSPLLLYMESGGAHSASAVFSDATTEQLLAPGNRIVRDALERIGVRVEADVRQPTLSIGYLIVDDEFLTACKSIRYGTEIGSSPRLFMRRKDLIADNPLPSPASDLLPVQVISRNEASSSCSFDSKRYYSMLKSNSLGHTVLFVPVTTTTMDVSKSLSDALPGYDGAVVIARQQLKGQGRGGNEFISPVGVAMFTFSYSLPSSSSLARCPSFLQHVAALALTMAVHELSKMEDFPLRIKWPNDFYFNRSHKIGGLLVTARTRDDSVEFTIGMGVNVSNSKPTTCLNDMLPDNAPESANFVVEEVIAATLTKFERLVNLYEMKGQAAFLDLYYKYWLHTREEVTLGDENERVIIRGLDAYGFLQVRSRKFANKLYSVTDDGNTFDMMKGLIRLKIK